MENPAYALLQDFIDALNNISSVTTMQSGVKYISCEDCTVIGDTPYGFNIGYDSIKKTKDYAITKHFEYVFDEELPFDPKGIFVRVRCFDDTFAPTSSYWGMNGLASHMSLGTTSNTYYSFSSMPGATYATYVLLSNDTQYVNVSNSRKPMVTCMLRNWDTRGRSGGSIGGLWLWFMNIEMSRIKISFDVQIHRFQTTTPAYNTYIWYGVGDRFYVIGDS